MSSSKLICDTSRTIRVMVNIADIIDRNVLVAPVTWDYDVWTDAFACTVCGHQVTNFDAMCKDGLTPEYETIRQAGCPNCNRATLAWNAPLSVKQQENWREIDRLVGMVPLSPVKPAVVEWTGTTRYEAGKVPASAMRSTPEWPK
jgi:hypothetical protein